MKCPICGAGNKPDKHDDCPRQDGCPLYDVRALVEKSGLAKLVLDGQTYTLRITRAGKLILTK
ncbi:hemin uptake protein HemP [Roseovarius sp. M141]|uniref:hemin uptake protein HemP n=1 Tax=Roseovarius sp. M141 TaxID=2583806 RepID=UPI0020CE9015|nr:hemin uptake protein HemP [Roseovarius sp. M141]MCQ0090599.1 hemin uptake protein HemP [Roseovarius sp. M141]